MDTDTEFETAFDEVETVEAAPVDSPEAVAPTQETVDELPAEEGEQQADVEADGEQAPVPDVTQELAAQAMKALTTAVAQLPTPEPAAPALDPKYLAQAIAEAQAQLQAQQTQAPVEEPKEATFVDFLDDKDKAALEVFKSEWSEVAAPVTALINAHVRAALVNQEKQILNRVEQHLAPIQQVTAKSQEAAHWASIQAMHPDFKEVVPVLSEWIGKQPSLIQPALRQAYEQGTAAQVNELIATYKQAIGPTGAAPAQPASSAAQVQPQAAPIPRAALAATLAPPAAKRSTASTSRDPNDFEAAFNEGL